MTGLRARQHGSQGRRPWRNLRDTATSDIRAALVNGDKTAGTALIDRIV